MPRLVAWRGTEPDRIDSAWVETRPSSLSARGTSLTQDYQLNYVLETGEDWTTRRLDVRVSGAGWWRTLGLVRDGNGRWSARADSGSTRSPATGEPAPAAPFDPEVLAGALDCDLGLCPLTNTMPVLRHGFVDAALRGEDRARTLTTAWVRVPDLSVFPSPQSYSAAGATGGGNALVDFRSGDFSQRIEIDAEGLVVNYPAIGRRLRID